MRVAVLGLVAGVLLTGCTQSGASESAADDKLLVATTVSPLTSIAANIIGDRRGSSDTIVVSQPQ